MGESLSDAGEFGFIAGLRRRFGGGEGVVIGPGDDAAAVTFTPGRLVLATTDMLVEGVHFDLAFSSVADVGYKAITASVSDIAAMGGIPRYALVALGAPGETSLDAMEALGAGMAEAGGEHGVAVVGGDLVSNGTLIVSVALLGEEGPAGVVRRSGARPGDSVFVTGALGAAAAGLALLRRASTDPLALALLERFPALAGAHRRPPARAREGLAAAAAGASAMIDCSDGLSSDALHIAEESATGIEIDAEAIPLADGVAEVAGYLGSPEWELGLTGGEDYELVLTAPPETGSALAAAVAPTQLTRIGAVIEGERSLLVPGGERSVLSPSGWDHFGHA